MRVEALGTHVWILAHPRYSPVIVMESLCIQPLPGVRLNVTTEVLGWEEVFETHSLLMLPSSVWASSSSPSSSSSSSSSPHFILLLSPLSSLLFHTPFSKDPHCYGIQTVDSWNGLCLATLLDTEVTNPMEYEFNFQLEIRGPCLLAGERALPRSRETKEMGLLTQSLQRDWGGARGHKDHLTQTEVKTEQLRAGCASCPKIKCSPGQLSR